MKGMFEKLMTCSFAVVAVAAIYCVAGCDGAQEPAATVEEPVAERPRLEDPEYMESLNECDREQTGIRDLIARNERALAKARSEDPEGTGKAVQALEWRRQELEKELAASQGRAADVVRARIMQDINNVNFKK